MRVLKSIMIAVPLLLMGCDSRGDEGITTKATDAADKKVASTLAIDTDGFKANIEIPGLQLAGRHMDIGGIKLYPGSTIRGMHIAANDKAGAKQHSVVFDFLSPGTLTEVVEHLTKQAKDACYAVQRAPDRGEAAVVEGRKGGSATDRFRVELKPLGTQTAGTATIVDTDT